MSISARSGETKKRKKLSVGPGPGDRLRREKESRRVVNPAGINRNDTN